MLSGFRTFSVGLGLTILPQVAQYLSSFDFAKEFGLSANASTVVGLIMIALRSVTSTPIFTQKATP